MLQSADNADGVLRRQKELKRRYMLNIDTDPDCVVLTTDMFLIVGSRRGHLLLFNLKPLTILLGGRFQNEQTR